jgi:NhaA family Na+:H+ antiporter
MGSGSGNRASEYIRDEQFGGYSLLVGAAVALIWVNLIDAGGYESFWHTELRIGLGNAAISEDLRHWVNDALMVAFFFLISLEVKREFVSGDLKAPRAAALPILAALGGVVVPALMYLLLVGGGEAARGWGIPMATDAAFAIGILALLGDRVPIGAKLFLVTLAVVDDVIAIAVIAIAYTSDLEPGWLAAAAAGLAAIGVMRRLGVVHIRWYIPIAICVWIATLESGVHATIAGVAVAAMVPARPVRGRDVMEELEDRVHPFSALIVLPLFALANAGLDLSSGALEEPTARRAAAAIAIALVAGKFIGIAGASLLAIRLKLGTLPGGVDRRSLMGLAVLAGLGFTVSLFITPLAFSDTGLQEGAKFGIFAGSIAAAALAVAILAPGGRHPSRDESEPDSG